MADGKDVVKIDSTQIQQYPGNINQDKFRDMLLTYTATSEPLSKLLEEYKVSRRVWQRRVMHDASSYKAYLQALQEKNLTAIDDLNELVDKMKQVLNHPEKMYLIDAKQLHAWSGLMRTLTDSVKFLASHHPVLRGDRNAIANAVVDNDEAASDAAALPSPEELAKMDFDDMFRLF